MDTPTDELERRFTAVFSEFQRRMFSLALGRLRDEARARDAVQEWGIKVWQHLGDIRHEKALKAWCYTTMERVLADAGRSRKPDHAATGTSQLEALPAAVPSAVRTTLQQWWRLQKERLEPADADLCLLGASVDAGELRWADVATIMNKRHIAAPGDPLGEDAWRKRYAGVRSLVDRRAQRQLDAERENTA